MADAHGRFVWYELMTTDVEAAKAFYADVVSWGTQDVSTPDMTYVLFTAGEAPVSGLMGLPDNAGTSRLRPSWLGYVGVDDVDAAAARIRELGGAVHVPPQEFPNVSRFSVVLDPQRATIALFKWLDPRLQQAAAPEAPGHVGWHELFATDWETAWPFYSDLFGWKKAGTDIGPAGSYLLFSAGEQTIGGMVTKPPAVPNPFWLYYFNVGDIDVAMKRVRAGGGEIMNGPIEVPGKRWIVQCMDPQGAIFALVGKRTHDGIGYFERIASRDP